MSNFTTIARPYAKAVFEHASAIDTLVQWSDVLSNLALLLENDQILRFIVNPAVTIEQQVDVLLVPFSSMSSTEKSVVQNLLNLLAQNKRLLLLPEIKRLFDALRAEQEKILTVDVLSFDALSPTQEQRLTESLNQRLQRKVTLNVRVDRSLIGGAIIQAGDLVIDGSVRGKLNKLGTELVA